jgi:steroid delta-isomerase-like uncharacterized protein
MGEQDTAAIAKSFFEDWNERDFDRGASLAAEDAEIIEVATNERFRGPDGLREEYEKWAGAFPDGKVEALNTVAARGSAVIESRFRGTHTGSFGDVPPTGKSLVFDFCTVLEVGHGKISRVRHYHDTGTIMQQLGLMPAEMAAR